MALPREGDWVPEVTLPMVWPVAFTIVCPLRGIPLSISSKPTNFSEVPCAFSVPIFSALIKPVAGRVTHPKPAAIGELVSLICSTKTGQKV